MWALIGLSVIVLLVGLCVLAVGGLVAFGVIQVPWSFPVAPPAVTLMPTPTSTPRPTDTPPPTEASPIPQACGMASGAEDYAPIHVGSYVILGRHREVDGDNNWSDQMDAYVGQLARVTRLSGVDGQGCPGVRVDVDNGDWFWRIRDLSFP